MKRFLAVLLASTTLLSTSVFAGDMRYVCNNDEAEVTADAIFKDGTVYLPVAQICRALGYKVIEKESNHSVTAEVRTKPGYFSVFLGKSRGRMNGMNITLSKTPFKENDVIYVYAGLIEDQLGVSVKYDSSKNTIYIDNTGEGKITSTVGQAPVAKPAAAKASSAGGSSSGSKSAGSSSVYPGTSVPSFAAVSGLSPVKSDNNTYIYEYSNNSGSGWDSWADNYYALLANNGFSIVQTGQNTRVYSNGKNTVTVVSNAYMSGGMYGMPVGMTKTMTVRIS